MFYSNFKKSPKFGMHINDLSSELLLLIFSNIDDLPQRIELGFVCKHWHKIISMNYWKTRECRMPLAERESLLPVFNQFGKWLEELWLQNIEIDDKLINQMAHRMQRLKHLYLCYCGLDRLAVDLLNDSFGRQLCSFIFVETAYLPNMRILMEKECTRLEHLSLHFSHNYSTRTAPNELPINLKSFSLSSWDEFYPDLFQIMSVVARDCANLKIFRLEIETLDSELIRIIGKIKSLVYLHLAVNSITNENLLQDCICHELTNLKALNIGYCSKETLSRIKQARPDLVHLNVFSRNFMELEFPDSLHSLTLRTPYSLQLSLDTTHFKMLQNLSTKNKLLQHLDIHSLVYPFEFIQKFVSQSPYLKSLHCQMPANNSHHLPSFLNSLGRQLAKGRNLRIYIHFGPLHCKYSLPDDLPQFNAGWRPKMNRGKNENLVLKKLIEETIGTEKPSFLAEWWVE